MEIEVQGLTINYEVAGEGRPCVMLHGGGLDHRHMMAELEPVFRGHPNWKRIYPDLPGQGRTPGATYAVLDRAGHLVNLEQQALFEALATEWLRRVEQCTGFP